MKSMDNSIVVQQATKADVLPIAQILTQSWRGAFKELVSSDELTQIASEKRFCFILENVLSCDKGHLRMALRGGDPAGEIFWLSGQQNMDAEIVSLFVVPQAWGQGVGKQLLLQAEKEIQAERDNELIELWTFQKNVHAQNFYERMGYTCSKRMRKSEFGGLLEIQYIKNVKAQGIKI